jgi:tRNA-specific 2-thiouridylase
VALDAPARRVVVGPRTEGTTQVRLRELNWLIEKPATALRCQVKLRARDVPRAASVWVTAAGAEVALDEPALPAPGQACVFYDGDRVLGGGFIRAPAVDAAGAARLSPRPLGPDGGVAQR